MKVYLVIDYQKKKKKGSPDSKTLSPVRTKINNLSINPTEMAACLHKDASSSNSTTKYQN